VTLAGRICGKSKVNTNDFREKPIIFERILAKLRRGRAQPWIDHSSTLTNFSCFHAKACRSAFGAKWQALGSD
jgi:hypothetical protein